MPPLTFQDIKEYNDGTKNTTDTLKWILDHPIKGCEQSFDESLTVVFFADFAVMVSSAYIQELREVL